MYILNVYQYLKPGTTKAFLEEVKKNEVCELAEKEPGCHKYAYYVPSCEGGEEHVLLVEKWENRDFQQEHLKLEAFARLKAFSGNYVLRSVLEAHNTQE